MSMAMLAPTILRVSASSSSPSNMLVIQQHPHVGHGGEALQLLEVGHRQNARHDFHVDTGGDAAVAEAQVALNVEEELGDGAHGAGVDLALQVNQIGTGALRLRVHFRVGSDGNVEVAHVFQQRHQIGRVHFRLAAARRQIAAQRHDMADAAVPVIGRDVAQLRRAGVDAGQVRRRLGPVRSLIPLMMLWVRSRSPELAP